MYVALSLTSGRVVLQPKVDVFLYSKPEAASVREVLALELVLLYLESPLEDFKCLLATNLTHVTKTHYKHGHRSHTTPYLRGGIIRQCATPFRF